MHKISDAMQRMLKARGNVAQRNVFFSSVIYHARMIESKNQEKASWTNGRDVFFNPEKITTGEKFAEGELLFQTLRCAFNHVSRRQNRDKQLWNVASELALTPVVKMVYPLPDSALHDKRFANMSAEEIYKIIEQENPPQQEGQDGDSAQGKGKGKPKPGQGKGKPGQGNAPPEPGMGEMEEPTEAEQAEADDAAQDWERVVKVAAEKADKAGTMPGYLTRMIEELWPKERIDWRLMLEDFIREAKTKVSGSWARPNRRFVGHGIYLPGWTNEKVFRVVLCLDSSGSITDEQMRDMKSEAMSLLDQQLCTHVTMISTDTRVCSMVDVSTSEEVKNFDLGHHGGGTDFKEAMKAVANIEDAVGCVFFTDMQTSSFGDPPGIPVVWVDWCQSGSQAPYGYTTSYK